MTRHRKSLAALILAALPATATAQLAGAGAQTAPTLEALPSGPDAGTLAADDVLQPPLVPIDDGVVLPGTPFAVFLGAGEHGPSVLLDAGLVPDAGLRVVRLGLPDGALPQDVALFFQNGDTIVCFGGPGRPVPQELLLVAPDPALGTGAVLLAVPRVDGAAGEAAGGAHDEQPRRGRRIGPLGHLAGPGAARIAGAGHTAH